VLLSFPFFFPFGLDFSVIALTFVCNYSMINSYFPYVSEDGVHEVTNQTVMPDLEKSIFKPHLCFGCVGVNVCLSTPNPQSVTGKLGELALSS
jgi:hypothetical protein